TGYLLPRWTRVGKHLQVGDFNHCPHSSNHRSTAPLSQLVNHSQVQVTLRSPPLHTFGNSRTKSLVQMESGLSQFLRLVALGQSLHGGTHLAEVIPELAS